jgi:Na+-translocating ferredoxin:NAD+ oxidoreductase RnfD subunit
MTPFATSPAASIGGGADAAAAPRPSRRRFHPWDPRLYQIAVLGGLLLYGVLALDFEIGAAQALVLLATALLTQYAGTRLGRLAAFDPRSALISGLSLCLLLRTGSLALAALAAAVTIGSKFTLRIGGKHVWNPTNFGIVATMLATGGVWVSPGQWGNAAFLGFLVACLGGLVVNRAARADVTYAFLGSYLAIVFGRALWLGQPAAIPLHQLASGAFLIFTFFMISDPKTTPDSRPGRIVYAALVAATAAAITFGLYRTNGLLFALALAAPLVPLIDRLLPGGRYAWRGRPERPEPSHSIHPTAAVAGSTVTAA